MAKRVQMIFLRKSNGRIDLPQPLGECIWVNELPMFVREEIGAEFPMCLPGFQLFPPAVAHKDPPDIRWENNLTAVAVFGRTFHNAFSRNDTAGAADREEQAVTAALEILPFEGA